MDTLYLSSDGVLQEGAETLSPGPFLPPRVREQATEASVSLGEDGEAIGLKVRYQEELARSCLRGDRIADTEGWPSATGEEDKGPFPSSLALAGLVSSASAL